MRLSDLAWARLTLAVGTATSFALFLTDHHANAWVAALITSALLSGQLERTLRQSSERPSPAGPSGSTSG